MKNFSTFSDMCHSISTLERMLRENFQLDFKNFKCESFKNNFI